MFQHLDTVISFVVLILVASLFITAATQLVVGLLGLRGANLRRSLADLFETACPDQDAAHWSKEIAGRVLRHPVISDSVFSRFYLRPDRIPFVPPETAGKLQSAAASIPLLSWIAGGIAGFFATPIFVALARRLFAAAFCKYSDLLASYISAINFCQHPWRTGLLVGAILGGLLSRWRLAKSICVDELLAVLEKLSVPLPGTLPDPAQRAMLTIAWAENAPRAKTKSAPTQTGRPGHSKVYFAEGMVRHAVKPASMQNEPLASDALDFDEGIVRHAQPAETKRSVAATMEEVREQPKELESESTPAMESLTAAPEPAPSEPHLEGLRLWFDHVMTRASQRFTLEARFVAVLLSCIFVFATHLDSVRLLRSMSQSAELRAQLAASAQSIDKQMEKFALSNEGTRTVVPDVYRKAMALVLLPVTAVPEPPKEPSKPKSRRSSRAVASPSRNSQQPAVNSLPVVLPVEDKVTLEAKAKSMQALEAVPGFASRQDAEIWLRTTLDGNSASDSLAAAYQQEVNAELVSDSDKLIDESASLKSELARSEFRLFPNQQDWAQSSNEALGLLITVALLSLCAAFWYNTLKSLASLRPLTMRPESERKKA